MYTYFYIIQYEHDPPYDDYFKWTEKLRNVYEEFSQRWINRPDFLFFIAYMAEAFAAEHNLFRSAGTMSRTIKSVIEGKIQNQAETEAYKQRLQEEILKKMKECKTLEEYFEKYRTM